MHQWQHRKKKTCTVQTGERQGSRCVPLRWIQNAMQDNYLLCLAAVVSEWFSWPVSASRSRRLSTDARVWVALWSWVAEGSGGRLREAESFFSSMDNEVDIPWEFWLKKGPFWSVSAVRRKKNSAAGSRASLISTDPMVRAALCSATLMTSSSPSHLNKAEESRKVAHLDKGSNAWRDKKAQPRRTKKVWSSVAGPCNIKAGCSLNRLPIHF